MAAQPIESLECYQFESSIRVVQDAERKSKQQLKDGSDSLKHDFKCSYRLTLPHLPQSPKKYKVIPSSYMNSTGTCGNFHLKGHEYRDWTSPALGLRYHYCLSFKSTQAKKDPNLTTCNASLRSDSGTITRLMSRAAKEDQGTLKYVWDAVMVDQHPVTFLIELYYSANVPEALVRHFCGSQSAQHPAVKSSLLNDVNTSGDLQLLCEVRVCLWASALISSCA
jgi:hypothetical protein